MRPLQDVRIIALEQYGAGPFGSMLLADLGAEVIKIEDPRGGDVGRSIPPHQRGDDNLFFESFNRNKKSIDLDVTSEAGRSVLLDLVARSDALYSNLRGDVPQRLRIRYDDLREINPRIVCASLSGFGMTGPRRAQPAYDYVLQGMAGWMSLTGEPDGPPAKSGLSLVDYAGGLVAALALVAGIHAARRDGKGMECDVSLFDTALAMLTYVATWHLTAGDAPERTRHSAHPSIVPFQIFRTADGWISIACAKEPFWQALTDAIERPELARDPAYANFAARAQHRERLLAILDTVFASRPSAEWLQRLGRARIPCGPVGTVEQALREPQAEAREMVVSYEHPTFGSVSTVASPVKVGKGPAVYRRAPKRNEHADEIFRILLEYNDAKIAALAAAGAFGKREQPGEGSS